MRKYLKVANFPRQLKHAEGTTNITVNCLIYSGVEIDAGRAVDYDVTIFDNFGQHLLGEA